ncbi:MAG TPA: chitobiase/beta-hexosaminidase C-terminal domain-containing protein [Methylomirabilota bacterium]|nr:chitobiase/beta-hexosaminidase C-terminal domain-containing protein [Methylomirabilota bacterium]
MGTKVGWGSASSETNRDIAIGFVTANSRPVWTEVAGGKGIDDAKALAELPDGGLLVGGVSSSPAGDGKAAPHYGGGDIWLIKYTKAGERQWDRAFGGQRSENLHAIHTNDAGILLFGHTSSEPGGNKNSEPVGGEDYWLVQLNSDGEIVKEVTIGTAMHDSLREVFPLKDGGWLLHGVHTSGISLIALNADLTERWRRMPPRGAVTTTRSGDIRFITGGASPLLQDLLLSAGGEALSEHWIPIAALAGVPHPIGPLFLTEGAGGDYVTTDLWSISHFREVTQPRGTPVFHTGTNAFEPGRTNVAISTTLAGGTIRYTTNGTPPTLESARYSGEGLQFSTSVVVRAIAYSANLPNWKSNFLVLGNPTISSTSFTIRANAGGKVRVEGKQLTAAGEMDLAQELTGPFEQTWVAAEGRTVRATALPQEGNSLLHWGARGSTNLSIDVQLQGSSAHAEAVFGAPLQFGPLENGSILVDGLPAGSMVAFGPTRLEAVPATGYYFEQWSGHLLGSNNPINFQFTPTNTISAVFAALPTNSATISATALGPGSVFISPKKNLYTPGETVRIEAVPDAGAAFLGWHGFPTDGDPIQQMTIDGSVRVRALFAGPSRHGFVAALAAKTPQDRVWTSTNLMSWVALERTPHFNEALIVQDLHAGDGRRYYHVSSASPATTAEP